MSQRDPQPYLERLRHGLVPIAAGQPGVCSNCRSGTDGGDRCWRCARESVVPVLPISMSVHMDPLHDRLRFYKNGSEAQRVEYTLDLAALLVLFLGRHLECLGGAPDFVVTVPSADRDAVKWIVDKIGWLSEKHYSLSATGTKEAPRFQATEVVSGRRVLLIDDTFTRGRSITAAHRALTESGAQSVTALVIGRHFHPNYDTSVGLWACLQRHRWSLDRCGICDPIDCRGDDEQRQLL